MYKKETELNKIQNKTKGKNKRAKIWLLEKLYIVLYCAIEN